MRKRVEVRIGVEGEGEMSADDPARSNPVRKKKQSKKRRGGGVGLGEKLRGEEVE